MYSYEDRKRAVDLYIQYHLSAATVIGFRGEVYPNEVSEHFDETKS